MAETEIKVSGLILSGGAGERMGGLDKGLVTWRGKRLIDHAIARLAPQVGPLLVSCHLPREEYIALGQTLVLDHSAQRLGPLAGLQAAVPCIETDFLAVVPCDMPLLPADLVGRLQSALEAAGTAAAYARVGEQHHYLCLVLRRCALDCLDDYLASGERSVRGWLQSLEPCCVDFAAQRDQFLNVNYPHQH